MPQRAMQVYCHECSRWVIAESLHSTLESGWYLRGRDCKHQLSYNAPMANLLPPQPERSGIRIPCPCCGDKELVYVVAGEDAYRVTCKECDTLCWVPSIER